MKAETSIWKVVIDTVPLTPAYVRSLAKRITDMRTHEVVLKTALDSLATDLKEHQLSLNAAMQDLVAAETDLSNQVVRGTVFHSRRSYLGSDVLKSADVVKT